MNQMMHLYREAGAEYRQEIEDLNDRITKAIEILENYMGEWLPITEAYLPEDLLPIKRALNILGGNDNEPAN